VLIGLGVVVAQRHARGDGGGLCVVCHLDSVDCAARVPMEGSSRREYLRCYADCEPASLGMSVNTVSNSYFRR
jgi:hypothetical protein